MCTSSRESTSALIDAFHPTGVIYVLANPSFPEYVKVGYADDVHMRVAQLNRTECTPFAFRLVATYAVDHRLADQDVHNLIDSINPALRATDTWQGKPRTREFFRMSTDQAIAMLSAMARIHGTEGRLTVFEAPQEEIGPKNGAVTRRTASFTFDSIGILPGDEIEFWSDCKTNTGIVCTVRDNRHIEYDGRVYTMSGFVRERLGTSKHVCGPMYFKYKGEWLRNIRCRVNALADMPSAVREQ